jgi:hypothetical protein
MGSTIPTTSPLWLPEQDFWENKDECGISIGHLLRTMGQKYPSQLPFAEGTEKSTLFIKLLESLNHLEGNTTKLLVLC